MLKINLTPQCGQTETQISWASPILTVNNESFDLSLLEKGAAATGHPVLGDVARNGDDYECTVMLGHGKNAPEATRFPESLTVTQDGIIVLPVYNVVTDVAEISHV